MIKNSADILGIIEPYVDLKKSGSNHKGLCPFHTERQPSFIVNLKRNRFHCFGCGAHGDGVDFIQKIKGISFKEALSYLGIDNKPYRPDPEEIKKKQLVKKFRAWCEDYHTDLCQLIRTLHRAKQNVETIEKAEALAPFYYLEPLWKFDIEILQNNDDEAKFNLYREIHGF